MNGNREHRPHSPETWLRIGTAVVVTMTVLLAATLVLVIVGVLANRKAVDNIEDTRTAGCYAIVQTMDAVEASQVAGFLAPIPLPNRATTAPDVYAAIVDINASRVAATAGRKKVLQNLNHVEQVLRATTYCSHLRSAPTTTSTKAPTKPGGTP